ncbi:MAG: hypothetical protein ACRBCS_07490 [Cellvibrionaceae bacterium]
MYFISTKNKVLGSFLMLLNVSAVADFEIKPKPNGVIPTITVSASADKTRYSSTQVAPGGWSVEVRGGFKLPAFSANKRIHMAGIEYGQEPSLEHYEIGVSGDHANLTGNNGNRWVSHLISSGNFGDLSPYIDQCNSAVSTDIANGLTKTQALNKTRNFEIPKDNSPYIANLKISPANINFYETRATTKLPLRVKCLPTGYTKPLPTAASSVSMATGITSSSLTILEQYSRFSGSCKITLSGVIQTNLPNTQVTFRYEHTNGRKSDLKTVTTSHAKTAMFSDTYNIDNNPYDDEAGSIRIIGVNHNFNSSWKTYTMRCEDAATNNLQTETPPQLTFTVNVRETQLVQGQICPKDVVIHGKLTAGSSISGNAVFIGSGVSAYQSDNFPYDLNIGQTRNFLAVRPVSLPSTIGSLQTNSNTPPVLRKVTLTQGMSIMDDSNKLVATTGQKNFIFPCSWPSVTPGLQQGGGNLTVQPSTPVIPLNRIDRKIKSGAKNTMIKPIARPVQKLPQPGRSTIKMKKSEPRIEEKQKGR